MVELCTPKHKQAEAASRSVLQTLLEGKREEPEGLPAVQDKQHMSSAITSHSHCAQGCLNPGNVAHESLTADRSLQNAWDFGTAF